MGERAYVTVLAWPKGFSPEDRVLTLVQAVGMDPYAAGLRAQHATPLIVARVDSLVVPDILAHFRARRVSAMTMTQTALSESPAPLLVKRLAPALGASTPMYMVELWKGDPSGLVAAEIFLLVRAAIDKTTSRTTVEKGPKPMLGAWGVTGAGFGGTIPEPTVTRTTDHKFTHVVDVYLRDGRLFRVNSDRVSFDVLGKSRGFTPRENADKLAARLAAEAPQALIDTGYERFKVPPDLARDCDTGIADTVTSRRDETSIFDFYSAWVYVIHRATCAPPNAV